MEIFTKFEIILFITLNLDLLINIRNIRLIRQSKVVMNLTCGWKYISLAIIIREYFIKITVFLHEYRCLILKNCLKNFYSLNKSESIILIIMLNFITTSIEYFDR